MKNFLSLLCVGIGSSLRLLLPDRTCSKWPTYLSTLPTFHAVQRYWNYALFGLKTLKPLQKKSFKFIMLQIMNFSILHKNQETKTPKVCRVSTAVPLLFIYPRTLYTLPYKRMKNSRGLCMCAKELCCGSTKGFVPLPPLLYLCCISFFNGAPDKIPLRHNPPYSANTLCNTFCWEN